jgi:hypothetical protein
MYLLSLDLLRRQARLAYYTTSSAPSEARLLYIVDTISLIRDHIVRFAAVSLPSLPAQSLLFDQPSTESRTSDESDLQAKSV